MGAQLVGVPSGQAGNAFANVTSLTLTHSNIRVGVSSRQFVMFPEEPGLKPVLPVDVPVTYEFWRDAGWDPNAAIVLAVQAAARPR